MEKYVKIPDFNTLQEMAEFWDTHEITDFEDQLIEVQEPIFKHLWRRIITVTLDTDQYESLQEIAEQERQDAVSLVHRWVVQLIEDNKHRVATKV